MVARRSHRIRANGEAQSSAARSRLRLAAESVPALGGAARNERVKSCAVPCFFRGRRPIKKVKQHSARY